jgi:hypothetical protein
MVAIVIAFAMGGAAAQAQPAGKVARVGYAAPTGTNTSNAGFMALRKGLQDLGYIDGKISCLSIAAPRESGIVYRGS